jgi:uncharacterized membrane protein
MSKITQAPRRHGITAPGLLLGIGLGGLVDGIVLHQTLQWHHMLTDPGKCPSHTVRGLAVDRGAETT